MPEQKIAAKRPLVCGLLAHVCATTGVPHIYNPEKLRFLRIFRQLLGILI